jgi:hypothetical protein
MSAKDSDNSRLRLVVNDNSSSVQHSRASSGNPFEHSTALIEVIPNGIDIEEEARLYEELCDVRFVLWLRTFII